jgi:hypothetical protein
MISTAKLIVFGAVLAVFAIVLYAYATDSIILLYGLIAFFPLVYLVNRQDVLFVSLIALYSSYLTLPQFPFKLTLFMVLSLVYSVVALAGRIISKDPLPANGTRRCVFGFIVVLLVTACARGFGLRMFGSATWGGAQYIIYFISSFFFLLAWDIVLTPRQWKIALYGMCLLSFIPMASQALYAFSGGRIWQHFMFIMPEMQVLEYMRDLQAGGQFARLQIANVASQYTFILALLIFGQKRRAGPVVYFLVILSFVLAGISGNRVPLIYILVLIIFYNLLNHGRRFLDKIRIPYVLMFLLTYVFLLVFARHLPMTFQRSLSFIPFMNVALEAKVSGLSTLGWRFEVWEAALRLIPQYFWVGRGFAFSSADVTSFSARTLDVSSSVDITLLTGNYHNGLINLIVDLGIFGFLAGMGFVFFAIRAERKNLRRNWTNPMLKNFHLVAFAGFMAHFIVYIVLGGGLNHIMTLFLWVLIMEGLVRTDLRLEALKEAEEHPVEQKPIWPGRRPPTSFGPIPTRTPTRY